MGVFTWDEAGPLDPATSIVDGSNLYRAVFRGTYGGVAAAVEDTRRHGWVCWARGPTASSDPEGHWWGDAIFAARDSWIARGGSVAEYVAQMHHVSAGGVSVEVFRREPPTVSAFDLEVRACRALAGTAENVDRAGDAFANINDGIFDTLEGVGDVAGAAGGLAGSFGRGARAVAPDPDDPAQSALFFVGVVGAALVIGAGYLIAKGKVGL